MVLIALVLSSAVISPVAQSIDSMPQDLVSMLKVRAIHGC